MGALTLEPATALIQTRGAVQARIRTAIVHLHFTVSPGKADWARALKTLLRVRAVSMDAGFLHTGHGLLLAVASGPALVAFATKCRGTIVPFNVSTRGAVHTGLFLAVGDLNFAIGAHESRFAFTGVRSLASVEAGSTVLTGFVICAVVQVLVAEQTAPAFVADAVPGFQAASVDASRVRFAFVAHGTFPASVATVDKRNGRRHELKSVGEEE